MFNSFNSSRNQQVEYWDFAHAVYNINNPISVSLETDCAPYHYIAIATALTINITLPTGATEGKVITFHVENQPEPGIGTVGGAKCYFFDSNQFLNINGATTYPVFTAAGGMTVSFICLPRINASTSQTAFGTNGFGSTTWFILQCSGTSSYNNYNMSQCFLAGTNVISNAQASVVIGAGTGAQSYAGYSVNIGYFGNSINTGANYSQMVGGTNNIISGSSSSSYGGSGNNTGGNTSSIIGSSQSSTTGTQSIILGGNYGSDRGNYRVAIFPTFGTASASYGGAQAAKYMAASNITITTTPTSTTYITQSGINALPTTNTSGVFLQTIEGMYFKARVISKLSIQNQTGLTVVGNGTTAVITLVNSTGVPAYVVGQNIVVTGFANTGFNGTFIITASTATTVSYANVTNASSTGGQIQFTSGAVICWTVEGGLARDNTGGFIRWIGGTAPTPTVVVQDNALSSYFTLTPTLSQTYNNLYFAITSSTALTNVIWTSSYTLDSLEATY